MRTNQSWLEDEGVLFERRRQVEMVGVLKSEQSRHVPSAQCFRKMLLRFKDQKMELKDSLQ